ncbi:glycosyltransferase family 4 protein [Stakelama sp. CBK3Z-3]|uniref:Glycosyltransferase family 4 protein n=1 Tax=Stakelama flava TaxID=2860338 RepID=A0ABS6XJ98_9SPHN|nr:glycosyltransferase family 4 protein [Stakelama flava]
MKVAHVITGFSLGGAEQVAEDLSLRFRARGINVHMVGLVKPDPALIDFSAGMKQRLADAGVPCHELGATDKRIGLIRRLPALAALLRRERFDLVHAHVDHAEFAVSMVRRTHRLTLARTIHNVVLWPGHRLLGKISERGWNDDLVIAVSPAAMDAHVELRRSLGLELSEHRQTILNGVPFRGDDSAKVRTGLLQAAFFGRSTPQKGLDVLIAALRALQDSAAAFHLTIYSDAVHDDGFRQAVADMTNVTLLPPVTDARQRISDFDLLIMPSRFEGLPLVALEAFASGTPVLATDAPGLRAVLPPDWPLRAPNEDAPALACKLAEAAADVDGTRRLRAVAAEHGRQFSVDRMCERYLDAYDAYLSTASSHRRNG